MEPGAVRPDPAAEFTTAERCTILESWNDPSDEDVSIARARVAPGVTTQLHRVTVHERYLVVSGRGRAEVDGIGADVEVGDIVVIPAGVTQRITNTGEDELVFYCVCTPRFTPDCYEALE